jgi:uncharacterized protein (UPF0548 family)
MRTNEDDDCGNLIVTLRDHRDKGWDKIKVDTPQGTVVFHVTSARKGAIQVRVSAPKTLSIDIVRAYTPEEAR